MHKLTPGYRLIMILAVVALLLATGLSLVLTMSRRASSTDSHAACERAADYHRRNAAYPYTTTPDDILCGGSSLR